MEAPPPKRKSSRSLLRTYETALATNVKVTRSRGSWFRGKRYRGMLDHVRGSNMKGKVLFVSDEDKGTFHLKATYQELNWSDVIGIDKRKSTVEFQGSSRKGVPYYDLRGRFNVPLECITTQMSLTLSLGPRKTQKFSYSMLQGYQMKRLLALILDTKPCEILDPIQQVVSDYIDDSYLLSVEKLRPELAKRFISFSVQLREDATVVPIPSSVSSFVGAIQGTILDLYSSQLDSASPGVGGEDEEEESGHDVVVGEVLRVVTRPF